ncbi:hypothetical protein ACIBP6_38910 [Nonomuraea terrae]|uniref:hypothetical protein n=1 Tax=Nonomuraea terrae TaxID=2530383 RepID=UPI00378A5229
MARYTEGDLRTAVEERRWLLPDVGEIARLCGRSRRRRRAATAVAPAGGALTALTAGAAVLPRPRPSG